MTERLAVKLLERAEQDQTAAGAEKLSTKELQGMVTLAMDLLVKLPKLKPVTEEEDDGGVAALRDAMTDPAKVVERLHANPKFKQALKDRGWLPPPSKVPHRPTKEQQADRAAYEERQAEIAGDEPADDSELQRLLGARA